MDAIVEKLRAEASKVDDAGRIKLLQSLRDLQLSIETPSDLLYRFAGLQLEIAAARLAQDLGLFQILASSAPTPLSTQDLASKTGAAPVLTRRIARYLASVGMIHETGPDTFAANSLSHTLAQPAYRGGIYHYFDNCGPVFQALPSFLAETKYQDVISSTNTAFHKVFSTDLPAMAWLPTQPERFDHLQQNMSVIQGPDTKPWFVEFPFEKEAFGSTPAKDTVLVDVGGGFGHQCAGLLAAFPDQLKGKLILQDLPQTIAMLPALAQAALAEGGVSIQTHDFFTPQPVKGARFYYLRYVMHDWPDETCVGILKHLAGSFAEDGSSQILIDDMVLPDQGAPWQAATVDFIMMGMLGSRERTVSEWRVLVESAGLEILRIDTYEPRTQSSIIQVGRKYLAN